MQIDYGLESINSELKFKCFETTNQRDPISNVPIPKLHLLW